MKHLLSLLIAACLMAANYTFSAPVSREKAKSVAFNFLSEGDSRVTSDAMSLLYSKADAYYVFGYQSGWVIISANDAVTPILAYSKESQFKVPENDADTSIGNNFWGWMKSIEDQIRFVAENNISATDEIQNQWISMSRGNNKSPTTVVPPLLTTTWGQGWPYNAYCPDAAGGPGGKAWAGCVATAMAQILHYNYSNQTSFQGVGSYSYQRAGWPVTGANFGATTYNMAIMPNEVANISDPGASEIATLTYHAAVGCKSIWGAASTGVMFSTNGGSYILGDYPFLALVQNYLPMAASSRFVIKEQYTDAEWHSLIQAELIANRPVYYRGDGSLSHACVCDGVDNSNMYHFNWGWDGQYNGYFALSNLNPGGNTLTNNQMAMIGLAPNDGSTLTTNTTWSGTMNVNSINVPDAVTLSIAAGTTINFSPNSSMRVWGRILSNGTQANMVKLTASNQTDGWGGIDFHEDYLDRMADNDTSKFIYTQIEYSKSSGLYIYDYGKVVVDYCKINDNLGWNGAGLSIWFKPINITNSDIYNNHSTNAGGGFFFTSTDNLSADISQNDIYNNMSDTHGGGFYFFNVNYVKVENNTFHQNQASAGAGGGLMYGSPSLVNNKFVNNIASFFGGGLYMEYCSAKIVNNLITNCDALSGAALGIWNGSTPLVLNNTISKNFTQIVSSIVLTSNSVPSFKNTIMYGNFNGNGKEFSLEDNGCDPIIDHCNLEGGINSLGGPGAGGNYSSSNYTNNIDSNPLFVSPSAGAGNGYNGLTADWSLQATSPCMNAGDTTGVSQYLPALDLDGNPRINGIIDMGAYEYTCPVPAQPSTITGNSNPCQTSSQVYSVTNVAGVTYTWSVPSGSTITAGQGSNAITVTIGSVSGDISVVPSNACGNGTAQTLAITVSSVPAQPSAISGNANPCQGSSQVYSVTNVAGVTYTWTVPSGSTITAGQGTNSITVTVGATSGNLSVVPSNACGNGTAQTLAITVSSVPAQPSAISGNANPCQGSSQGYSVTNVAGVTYTWTVPSGSTITAGQGTNSITVTVGATSGNLSVVPSNACGNGTAQTLAITVSSVPAQPSAISGNANPCQGSSQVYSVTNVAGVTYTWTVPSGSTITAGQGTNSITVTVGATPGDVVATPSNSCGNGISRVLTISIQNVVADAGADQTINNGTSTTLNGSGSGGSGNYGYSWEPASLLVNNTLPNPTTLPLSATTQFVLTVTDNTTGCVDGDEVIVNVTGGALAVTATANPATICMGDSSQLNALASGGSGVYSYSWVSNPAGFSSTVPNPVVWPVESTQYTVEVNDGFGTTSSSVVVDVTPLPEAPMQPSGPDTVDLLQNGSSVFTTGTVQGAITYDWLLEPAMLGTWEVNGPICTITWSGSLGTGQVKVRAVGSCGAGEWSPAKEVVIENTTTVAEKGSGVWRLYPNPANQEVTITSQHQLLRVQIAELTGRVIETHTPAQPQFTTTLNTSGLKPSVYLLTILTPQGQFSRRMVISR